MNITMCSNTTCKQSAECKRHADSGAKADFYGQYWTEFKPVECDTFGIKRLECEHFLCKR
jgi:hypothetical protein